MDSPGAGPSRTRSREDEDRAAFLKHRKDYLDLQESVQSSTELLSSLASYLSTFQTDLSAVSGHISELQQKSADIDGQLKGRRNIIPSLNALVADITLPPSLVLTLRDTTPSQNPDQWLAAIPALEQRILALAIRGRVRAAHEIEKVVDGLRTKALTQLPPFLLSLIRPLRSASKGLSTNLAVLQTSLLLKYQPFYTFLVRQSPRLARQVERGYVSAARSYYETGFRRYCRALATIKARTPERSEPLGYVSTEAAQAPASVMAEGIQQAYERLQFAAIDAEGQAGNVVLAYMADDKDFTVPVESLFRSLGLVLVDNASAEFTFIVRFFTGPHAKSKAANVTSPSDSQFDITSDAGRTNTSARPADDLQDAERIWHDVLDPALEYCANFFQGMLNPPPPAMPLLTIIRFNDRLIEVCDSRGTLPLKTFLMAQKLAMWPIYRKEMDQHVDSLNRLADDAEGKGLAGFVGRGVKDGAVRQVASRYATLFTCVTALSEDAEEAMMFSSMSRMRAELVRLFQNQSQKIKTPADRHSFLSSLYEIILHELVSGPGHTSHPRLQAELSYFRTREEESRRRISS